MALGRPKYIAEFFEKYFLRCSSSKLEVHRKAASAEPDLFPMGVSVVFS